MRPLAAWLLLIASITLTHPAVTQAAEAASRQQAIDMAVQQNGGGKVLGVKIEKAANGRTVFAVKIMANGRIRMFRIQKAE